MAYAVFNAGTMGRLEDNRTTVTAPLKRYYKEQDGPGIAPTIPVTFVYFVSPERGTTSAGDA
jgi:hypothetical protein